MFFGCDYPRHKVRNATKMVCTVSSIAAVGEEEVSLETVANYIASLDQASRDM
jgi:hypothetical protein